MTDATREGVSGAELQPDIQAETPLTDAELKEQHKQDAHPRNRTIEDLAAKFHARRAADLGLEVEAEDEAPVAEAAPAAAPVAETPVAAPPAPPAAPAPDLPVYLREGKFYTRLKVNGQEQEIEYAKVVATMQKHTAADQRLQHASELLRKAEERERATRESEERLRQRLTQPSTDAGGENDEELRVVAKTVINKLLDGETEQAADDLVKMFKGRRDAPTPDYAQIEQRATAKALEAIEKSDYQKDVTRGNQQFAEQYPEIMADPDLFTLADQKTVEIMREKPYLTPSQVLMEAGEAVMTKFVRRSAPPAADPRVRTDRKAQLKPVPRPASARQAPTTPAPAPMSTPSSYFEAIKKARGQGR